MSLRFGGRRRPFPREPLIFPQGSPRRHSLSEASGGSLIPSKRENINQKMYNDKYEYVPVNLLMWWPSSPRGPQSEAPTGASASRACAIGTRKRQLQAQSATQSAPPIATGRRSCQCAATAPIVKVPSDGTPWEIMP